MQPTLYRSFLKANTSHNCGVRAMNTGRRRFFESPIFYLKNEEEKKDYILNRKSSLRFNVVNSFCFVRNIIIPFASFQQAMTER